MTTQVTIYPNPFESALSLEVVADKDEATIVKMVDYQQKIVKMLSWHLQKGTNKTSLEGLQSLTPGDYFVEIQSIDGHSLFTARLIKE